MVAVLFDMDGVLVHSRPVWRALVDRMCRELGYPVPDEPTWDAMWGQGVQADVDQLFVRHTVEEVSAFYDRWFMDHAGHLAVEPDAVEVIDLLRRRGVRIAVVTNTPRPLADAILAHAGVVPDTLVGGTDTPRAKPFPDPVRLACERLGVAPAEAVMVGDSRFDREAAEAAGVPFVPFRMGPGSIDALTQLVTS